MKTKLQDLDETAFKELIADKLGRGPIYRKTYVDGTQSSVNERKDKSEENDDKYGSLPVLEKEEPLHVIRNQKKLPGVARNEIKKSCRCQECQSTSKKGQILRRQDFHSKDIIDSGSNSDNSEISTTVKNAKIKSLLHRQSENSRKYKNSENKKSRKKESFFCRLCGQNFLLEEHLDVHNRIYHQRDESQTLLNICSICGAKFRWRNNLLAHLRVHSEKDGFKCDACGETFPQKVKLKEHMKKHVEHRLHQCHICEARFLSESTLQTHLKTHDSESPFKCVICGEGFVWENSLEEHVLSHIAIYPYKCSECGAGFHHELHLKEHESLHKIKSYICKMCSESFSSKRSLREHMRYSHKTHKIYNCHKCEETFRNKATLKSHKYNKHKNKYGCDICEKSFPSRIALRQHEIKHLSKSSDSCESNDQSSEKELPDKNITICNDKFDSAQDLKDHKRNHETKYKKSTIYECEICQKSFKKSKYFHEHILSHPSGVTVSCKCQICNESFQNLKILKRHIEKCHDMQEYQCDMCDQRFTCDQELERHISKHFEKNKALALDVSKKVRNASQSLGKDYFNFANIKHDGDVQCTEHSKDNTRDSPNLKRKRQEPSEYVYSPMLKRIKQEPNEYMDNSMLKRIKQESSEYIDSLKLKRIKQEPIEYSACSESDKILKRDVLFDKGNYNNEKSIDVETITSCQENATSDNLNKITKLESAYFSTSNKGFKRESGNTSETESLHSVRSTSCVKHSPAVVFHHKSTFSFESNTNEGSVKLSPRVHFHQKSGFYSETGAKGQSPHDKVGTHVLLSDSVNINNKKKGSQSEIESEYSPQSSIFSPGGKSPQTSVFSPGGKSPQTSVFSPGTDSGYSDKMTVVSSDVESVYSPMGIDVNIPHLKMNNCHNWIKSNKDVNKKTENSSNMNQGQNIKMSSQEKIEMNALEINSHAQFEENETIDNFKILSDIKTGIYDWDLYADISKITPVDGSEMADVHIHVDGEKDSKSQPLHNNITSFDGNDKLNIETSEELKTELYSWDLYRDINDLGDFSIPLSENVRTSDIRLTKVNEQLNCNFNTKDKLNELGFYTDMNCDVNKTADSIHFHKTSGIIPSSSSQSHDDQFQSGSIIKDKSLSNGKVHSVQLNSSNNKSRVPFFCNFQGKKQTRKESNNVNFHWLGKLK